MKKTNIIKKIMTVLLIGCMALCIVACGKSNDSTKSFDVTYNVQGQGMVAGAPEGTELDFSKSTNGGIFRATDGSTYVIEARDKDGSSEKFVKWTNNGKDYSTDRKITVKASGDTKLVAVFQ